MNIFVIYDMCKDRLDAIQYLQKTFYILICSVGLVITHVSSRAIVKAELVLVAILKRLCLVDVRRLRNLKYYWTS